ncbi:hypothetical protein E1263_14415 [Kribbella antibiotica]|uniref:Uncharacterized protein n=1 Tax=Kribbella antibiotica TaxID=190195 RepID=A0A4R4ZMQ7_9ACTN|nr:hypothetical protein [Kribbella antibiotica]TDD59540.1 hypothetical protein E1263_14415 [Kribbella antibiotica]
MSTKQWHQPGNDKLSPAEVSPARYRHAVITGVVAGLLAVACVVYPFVIGRATLGMLLPALSGTVVAGGFGFSFWWTAKKGRRDTLLIEHASFPAFADVLSVQDHKWSETSPGYAIEVRVSGPDIQPFQATFKSMQLRPVQVGERLGARVVPAAHLYQVQF